MEPDLARGLRPDTNVGKKAHFVTTLVRGAARNYGDFADERKGKRIHFRNRNGVLYEFRNSQGFVQYTCVDCEKQTPKKYALVYVDQDGRYTREPEEAMHLCSGHGEIDMAAPDSAVLSNASAEYASSSTGLVREACLTTSSHEGLEVLPGIRVSAADECIVNPSSKEVAINHLEQLLQEQPGVAQLTLPALLNFLKSGKFSSLPTTHAPTSSSASGVFCILGGSITSGLRNSATTTTICSSDALVALEAACVPSSSKQETSSPIHRRGPHSRAPWTNPPMVKRPSFKKVIGVNNNKPKRRRPPSEINKISKTSEAIPPLLYSRLKAELEKDLAAHLERKLADSQEKFLALKAMLKSDRSGTAAYISAGTGLRLSSAQEAFLSATADGSVADQGAAASGADIPSFVSVGTVTMAPIATGKQQTSRESLMPCEPYFGGGAIATGEQQEISGMRTQPEGNAPSGYSAEPHCNNFQISSVRYGHPECHPSVNPVGQVPCMTGSQQRHFESLAIGLPETTARSSFPQNDPSISNNARHTLEVPLNVSAENEPVLIDLAAWGHEQLDELLRLRHNSAVVTPQVLRRTARALVPSPLSDHFPSTRASKDDMRSSATDTAVPRTRPKKEHHCPDENLSRSAESARPNSVPAGDLSSLFGAKMLLSSAGARKVHPSSEGLRPETVIKLLEATVQKIVCSEVFEHAPDRSKLDHTIQAWHRLGLASRTVYDHDVEHSEPEYSQKQIEFISSHLTELVPSAVRARSIGDLVCCHALLNYISSVLYSWYISYDFDAISWIRKMFCTAVPFRETYSDGAYEMVVKHSLILPGLASETLLYRQLFNYSMPVESIRIESEGSEDSQENMSHFGNMRKMYNIIWSDKLLSQESFPANYPFIKQCLAQDHQHGSMLLSRMVLRRAISAVVQAKYNIKLVRNVMFLHRLLVDNGCDMADISGLEVTDYANKFGKTSVLEYAWCLPSENLDRKVRNLGRETANCAYFQYCDCLTGLLWDSVDSELQRPVEMSATKLFIEPGFIEFSNWRFEPQHILRVLRSDVSYLKMPLYPDPHRTRRPRAVRPKTYPKRFHLVLDLGNTKDDDAWHYGSGLKAKFHYGRLMLYFVDKDKKDTEDMVLLDYTLSFGSSDRPGPILRFLRIVEMIAPVSASSLEFSREIEATPLIQQGLARSRETPHTTALSIDKRMKFHPYIEVRGTAIPIYSPLKDLNKLLEGVPEKSERLPPNLTPQEKLDHALDQITAKGWSKHTQGSKQTRRERLFVEKAMDASQRKDSGAVDRLLSWASLSKERVLHGVEKAAKHSSRAQANNGDGAPLNRILSRSRRSETHTDDRCAPAIGNQNIAPNLNDVN